MCCGKNPSKACCSTTKSHQRHLGAALVVPNHCPRSGDDNSPPYDEIPSKTLGGSAGCAKPLPPVGDDNSPPYDEIPSKTLGGSAGCAKPLPPVGDDNSPPQPATVMAPVISTPIGVKSADLIFRPEIHTGGPFMARNYRSRVGTTRTRFSHCCLPSTVYQTTMAGTPIRMSRARKTRERAIAAAGSMPRTTPTRTKVPS